MEEKWGGIFLHVVRSYTVTKEDYLGFCLVTGNTRQKMKEALIIFSLLVLMILLNFIPFDSVPFLHPVEITLFALFALYFFISALSYYGRPRRVLAKLQKGEFERCLGPHTITLEEEALVVENAWEKSSLNYQGLEKITPYKTSLILLKSPTQGYVLPETAFESPEDKEAFLGILLEKTGLSLGVARNKPPV